MDTRSPRHSYHPLLDRADGNAPPIFPHFNWNRNALRRPACVGKDPEGEMQLIEHDGLTLQQFIRKISIREEVISREVISDHLKHKIEFGLLRK